MRRHIRRTHDEESAGEMGRHGSRSQKASQNALVLADCMGFTVGNLGVDNITVPAGGTDSAKLQVVYNTQFGELWEERGDHGFRR